MLTTSQYVPNSQFQRVGETLINPNQPYVTNAGSYSSLPPSRYDNRPPMMNNSGMNEGNRRNSRGRESPLLMKTGGMVAGAQPLIGFNLKKDPNLKAQDREMQNPFTAFNQHPIQVLTQPIPTISPEEQEYVSKTLMVQENIKNAISELDGIKKKYGRTERENRILKALKKQELILDELEQDLKENTKRKLDEKIEEFHAEYQKYLRGISDESDIRSKYREVQFYAGNFPIPIEYLIAEATALRNAANPVNKYRYQWFMPPSFGLANQMPYADPYSMYSDPLYLMTMMKNRARKAKQKEKERQALIDKVKQIEQDKLKNEMDKKKDERKKKIREIGMKKLKKCVWAVYFGLSLKAQADHAFKQSASNDFLAERNRKFKEVIDPALNMGLYLAKFCENSIIMVIDERANMNIIPQLEKKKKFTDAELDNKILLIKQKIEVFISDLLKAKVFPIELLQFLSLITFNGKIAPDNYFYPFEINRFKFTRMRGFREMDDLRVNMNISFFFIIRVIIHKMLLQYDKYFKISQKPLITRNIKTFASLIYHITKGVFANSIRPDTNNQNNLTEKFKLHPASLSMSHSLINTDHLPGEEENELIGGLYPADYLDSILSDKAWINKISEGITYWCNRVHNLIKLQIAPD